MCVWQCECGGGCLTCVGAAAWREQGRLGCRRGSAAHTAAPARSCRTVSAPRAAGPAAQRRRARLQLHTPQRRCALVDCSAALPGCSWGSPHRRRLDAGRCGGACSGQRGAQRHGQDELQRARHGANSWHLLQLPAGRGPSGARLPGCGGEGPRGVWPRSGALTGACKLLKRPNRLFN